MPSWLFFVALLAVWILWAVAAAARCAVDEVRRGGPVDQRHGVSIVPALPFFPLVFWGAAAWIDRAANPWGTRVIGSAHALFTAALAISLVRDRWRLRAGNKHP